MAPPVAPVARPPWAVTAAFLTFVGLLVVAPLVALVVHGVAAGPAAFAAALQRPTAVHALLLTLGLGLLTTVINGIAGLGVAWALVRWEFPGRGLLERLVELPLAVPTLVAGVLIVALYGPQGVFGPTLEGLGLQIVYARPALLLALLFITFPFGVRAVEPALRELDPAEEQAAWTLGATRAQAFRMVTLPALAPALAAGAVQIFARCVAEFGAVALVSGNVPGETLTATVYLLGEVEAGDTQAAAAVSLLLLGVALTLQPLSRRLAAAAGRP
jgi:sulfate transport system permease protein